MLKGYPCRSQPRFAGGRALSLFLLCAGIRCLLGTGTPTTSGLAVFGPEVQEKARNAVALRAWFPAERSRLENVLRIDERLRNFIGITDLARRAARSQAIARCGEI